MKISKADKNNRRKDTRLQILNIAQEIIATQGLAALSLRKIADQLGILPPSIYTHFKSIDAIVDGVSQRVYGSFTTIRHAKIDLPPFETLESHISALIDHMVENPVYIQLMLKDFGSLNSQNVFSEDVNQRVDDSFANVQKMLDSGAKAGVFRPANADQYLACIFGAGLINLAWSGFGEGGQLEPVAPIDQIKSDLFVMAKAYLAPQN